ncbi:MAG: phage major capsid protein [Bacteroidota bacterium]
MDVQTEKDLLEKVGKEATEAAKLAIKTAEDAINGKTIELTKGLMSKSDFDNFKAEQMAPIQALLNTLDTASKEQGIKMAEFLEKATPNSKTLEQFIEEKASVIKDLRTTGKFVEITGAQLKAAGVQSIAGTIPTPSPYAPGVSGVLEIFDILRNPNFITSKVDMGRTNQSRLAWANELDPMEGGPALVAEGALKPQIQHKFTIETSTAKKVAGWIELTDEFEQDLPNFASNVRRKLQEDVERAFDDLIQIDVQDAARPYEITGLDGQIAFANRWDAILAMMAQVGSYNFVPNAVAINWITNAMLQSAKNENGTYLLPSFADDIRRMLVYSNKMANGHALVGDLKQYHVDIYKDFVLKIGWINDEFIYNKFAIVGEMRFHSYISDARKKALVYDSLAEVANTIEGSGSF